MERILVVNPGSTSTKIAVFQDEKEIFNETIRHSIDEIKQYKKIIDQHGFRTKLILGILKSKGVLLEEVSAIGARGGLLHPLESGTYLVNDDMVNDLNSAKYGEHASNLGAIIAHAFSTQIGKPAFIVDPVIVDEMNEIAKISGFKGIRRVSIWHALNQKLIARQAAKELGKTYKDLNLIIVHLGGGISVAAHCKGKAVDVNNALNGDGPFSPERAGGLPLTGLVNLCYSKKYTYKEMKKNLAGKGGLVSHLGINSAIEVEKRIKNGDKHAKLVYEAMAYQIAKTIGEMSTVLQGNVDAIVITGGIAYSKILTEWIKERVSFIAPVKVYPGEDELSAIAQGVLRILRKEEEVKLYESV
ncbi:MAG: butyrate kinase [Caldiserica bacterium]|nr:MAG: butyrate kinase [Caldisericota bacterium]